jgi:biofilm PGA synthesis protein PgaD
MADTRSLIIDHPDRQNRGRRIGFGIVTLVFWIIWIYLWLPLITAFAWYLGFERFQYIFIELDGFEGLLDILGVYFTVLQLIVVVFLAWSLYNQHRFGGKDKRRQVRKTNYRAMCESFGLSRHGLNRLRHAKIATVDYRIGATVSIIDTSAMSEFEPLGEGPDSPGDSPTQEPDRERRGKVT